MEKRPVEVDIQKLRCPNCGEPMSQGYIAGEWYPLRWLTKPDAPTVFAGEPLHKKKGIRSTATLEAVRCERCAIGVFRYDQEAK